MQTRQNNNKPVKFLARIGPVIIGKGYMATKKQRHLYPWNRLEEFLNLDISDEEKIIDFCKKHLLFPTGEYTGEHSWLNFTQVVIPQEQNEIKNYTKRAQIKQLTIDDYKFLNEKIKTISLSIRGVTDNQMANLNDELCNFDKGDGIYEGLNRKKERTKPLLTYSSPNQFASLWLDLLSLIIKGRTPQNCLNCGQFFTKKSQAPVKMFCNTQCGNTYAHRQDNKGKK